MSKVLDGSIVIVTGAARGLGRAYALDIADQGGVVVVNDLEEEAVAAVVDEIVIAGGTALGVPASVSVWDDAQRLVNETVAAFGRIDGLVNNAGVTWMGPCWEQDESDLRRLLEVNILGALFVGTLVIRTMVEQRSGAIVNATSSAQMGIRHLATYGATKGALASLTYGWSLDLAEYGVRVNGFAPSAMTQMVHSDRIPSGHLREPSENAPVVSYLLSDRADGITGQIIQWRQGALAIVSPPSLTSHQLHRERWTAENVAELFGPLLERHAQPVGWRVGS